METDRKRLVARGGRVPTDALLEQAGKSLETGSLFKNQLLAFGFTAAKFDELEARRQEVSKSQGARTSTVESSKGDTRSQAQAIRELKAHFLQLKTVLPMVVRDHAPEGIGANSFAPEGRLGRSARKVVHHADKVRDLVVKLEGLLAPYFGGASPIETHDRLRNAVDLGNARQETRREAKADKTAAINLAKGRLLELIDDMDRVGRIAFRGQAETAARFNKALLQRDKRQRRSRKKAASDTAEEPPAAATATADPA